jgi:hypothetical protein
MLVVQENVKPTVMEIDPRQNTTDRQTSRRPKIAIVTGFVGDKNNPDVRLSEKYFSHMINKACYTDIWDYDLIFNTTWGFPNVTESQYWLQWGTWHRVPHMMAALEHYDWIVYADTDWIVQDLMYPLESFINDWDLHGQDVSYVIRSKKYTS